MVESLAPFNCELPLPAGEKRAKSQLARTISKGETVSHTFLKNSQKLTPSVFESSRKGGQVRAGA